MATVDPNAYILEAATSDSYTPTDSEIKSWTSSFVPGITSEYTNYFNALIKSASTLYGAKSTEVAQINSMKSAWEAWSKKNSLLNVDLSKSGGKTRDDLRAQIDAVKTILKDQTNSVNSVTNTYDSNVANTAAKGSLTTALNTANTNYTNKYNTLYGVGGTQSAPKANSLLAKLNTATTALQTAKTNLANNKNARATSGLQNAVTNASKNLDTIRAQYDTAVSDLSNLNTQKSTAQTNFDNAVKAKDEALNNLDDTMYKSLDAYTTSGAGAYNAFLTNRKVPNPKATEEEIIADGLDYYKKYGQMDPNLDPKLVNIVQKQYDAYQQEQTNAAYAAKYSQATDLAGALKDYTANYKLPDPAKNKALYNQVLQSIAAGIDTPDKLAAKADQDAIAKTKADQDAIAKAKADQDAIAKAKADQDAIAKAKADQGVAAAPAAPYTGATVSDIINYISTLKGTDTGFDINGLINYLATNKRGVDTSGQAKPGQVTPAINVTPTPTVSTPVTPAPVTPAPVKKDPGTLGITLPSGYNARSTVQDIAGTYEMMHPRTYAPGQFDPFYSGAVSGAAPYSQTQGTMNAQGAFTGGTGFVTPSTAGFGFQNAYIPTGAAAGGYMDSQAIAQQNQALQQQAVSAPQSKDNYSLGLGAIPNMTQYTDYTNNPGITSVTQNVDDGSVGGIPVPGQTNPVW